MQASVSMHADQVATVLTLSKSSPCHVTIRGSFEFDFAFFQGLSLSGVFLMESLRVAVKQ